MTEIWLPAVGYEGHYEVSDHGRVRSLDRIITRPNSGPFFKRGTILRPQPCGDRGRLQVNLKGRLYQVHRLVLETFIGPCPIGMEGLHTDDDLNHNHLANLRWGTRSDNMHDRVKNGRHFKANQTHCIRGHEFDTENTYFRRSGGRICKECARDRRRQRQAVAR